jgi:long-subunit acyl-CoA synthetase (AMP-forming)
VLLLCKHPVVSSYDLSSIRMTNSGAAPLSREMVETCFGRTGVRVKQGYGLSETSPTAFNQPWDDWNVTIGSVGQVLSNMEAKICTPGDASSDLHPTEEEATLLPLGETGELMSVGPTSLWATTTTLLPLSNASRHRVGSGLATSAT